MILLNIKTLLQLHKNMELQNKVSDKIIENPKNPKNKGGRPSQEYYITLDMVKQLAMVERNETGI